MTTTLIVLAHPGKTSFNAAWAEATSKACEDAGHDVIWSDLYAQRFQPAEAPEQYEGQSDDAFDPLKAQERAAQGGTLPADVAAEVTKIRQADRIVFHFPIWWFAPPAILKGWCDRALVHGLLHDVDNRFDTGLCKGKSAIFCVTTGATEAECGSGG